MEDAFELPVTYRGKEHTIIGQLRTTGYTYRIEATVEGTLVYFEPDEERNFRAILPPETPNDAKLPDTGLLEATAQALHDALS